jgi:hypothetical protein
MAIGPDTKPRTEKPIGTLVNELVEMMIAYVRQQTILPIKSVGRYIAFGIAGGLLFAIGGLMLILAAVRAVQAEAGRHLGGSFTWAPYMAGILVAVGGVVWAVTRIGKGRQ